MIAIKSTIYLVPNKSQIKVLTAAKALMEATGNTAPIDFVTLTSMLNLEPSFDRFTAEFVELPEPEAADASEKDS